MITGTVNASREARIHLSIRDVADHERDIEAVVDTGFNGPLTLPSGLIANLGLPWRTRTVVVLANGATEECDVYTATITWDGSRRRIVVQAADTTPLVGMGLLYGYQVIINVVEGGQVVIRRPG